MVLTRHVFPILFLVFITSFSFAQVQSVSHMIRYNDTTCHYDCYMVIEEGSATSNFHRIQFSAQYSLVVPTNTTVLVEESYMPLRGNANYDGTVPCTWSISTSHIGSTSGLDVDLHGITPSINPTSRYNNLYAEDTIKLFTVSIAGLSTCSDSIRLYENGNDYPSSVTGGGDFSNGMTIGGTSQLWESNIESDKPVPPSVPAPIISFSPDLIIDISPEGPACQGPLAYSWIGPNGYSSTLEDVNVPNATIADYGAYEVTVTDDIGCADTITYLLSQESGNEVDINEVTLNDIKLHSTYEHISVHADILGDDNHNSTMSIEYRLQGKSNYKSGAETMRAFPEMIVDGNSLNENFHAGSALFLQPNSSYELKITIDDIDGGSTTLDTTIMTKSIVFENPDANVIYAAPGNGGGSGTVSNPYLGIQAAVDNSVAGDVISVASGTYDPFTITTDGTSTAPIILKSEVLHQAIIDGNNTGDGIITIGSFSDSIAHIVIDGFEIRNGSWGIDAQNTQHITIRNNKIMDVDFGIVNRRENGWEHNQHITNNEIVGNVAWPQTNGEIPGERGIDIRGNNNVVSYNTISEFGDGISTDGQPYNTSYSLDIHNNDINRIVDDLIEVDGMISNSRIYDNRAFNGRAGISLAPVFGGPAYVFRNVFFNMENSAFKMNRKPAGLYIVHNTIAKADDGISSPSGWQNTVVKNNVILSSEYCMQEYGLVAGSEDDWDYNAYKSLRAGVNGTSWFKWNDVRYNQITDLQAGTTIETMGFQISESDIEDIYIPTNYATEALVSDVDFAVASGSSLINAGTQLDNLNDRNVSDATPDVGARELGSVSPQYGHSFLDICSRNNYATMTWNGSVNQGWYQPQNWIPCGIPNKTSQTLLPANVAEFPFVNTSIISKNLTVFQGGYMRIVGDSTELKLVGNN